jgi:hypothetical protein
MLTHEVMGLLGLAILWVNTLLVVLAAFTPLFEHSAVLARIRRHGLRRGRVTRGAAAGVFASHTVIQVGRMASDDADRRAISFHDRDHVSSLAGGVVSTEGGEVTVAAGPAEVWFDRRAREERAACADDAAFDAAYAAARKPKGFAREVRCELAEGDEVWLLVDDGVLVASFDPRPLLRGRIALVLAAQLAMLAAAGAITWLCLLPPLFGTTGLVGAGLGLAYFLLVQPAGVSLREATLLPARAFLRGSWVRAGSEGTTAGVRLPTS